MDREKERKTQISRESCQKQLRANIMLDCHLYLILTVLCAVICLPFAVLIIGMTNAPWFLRIVGGVIFSLPSVIVAVPLSLRLFALRRVARGDFVVLVDEVSELRRDEPQGRHTVDVIYFSRYGRYVSGGTEFELADVGDRFYLVVLEGRQVAELAYSQKLYDCKQEDIFVI